MSMPVLLTQWDYERERGSKRDDKGTVNIYRQQEWGLGDGGSMLRRMDFMEMRNVCCNFNFCSPSLILRWIKEPGRP